jgi:hypothetical protein
VCACRQVDARCIIADDSNRGSRRRVTRNTAQQSIAQHKKETNVLEFLAFLINLGDHDGTGPATTLGAAEFGARVAERLAQKAQEGLVRTRLGGQLDRHLAAVDVEEGRRTVACRVGLGTYIGSK